MEGGVSPLGFVTVKVSVRHWVAAPTSLAPPMKRKKKHEFGILLPWGVFKDSYPKITLLKKNKTISL
jgi:hypothetical protein